MALSSSPAKRAFSDFRFLEDGIPMSATDVPYQPPPTIPPIQPSLLPISSPRNLVTAQPSAVNHWGFALSRALGAVNFIRPTIHCLSNVATNPALYILQALPEGVQKFLQSPVNIIAVPVPDGNKRRSVEVPTPRVTPQVVAPSRALPRNQHRKVAQLESPVQPTTVLDSQQRVSSVPKGILCRPRTRKSVSFDLSLNQLQLISPHRRASPDLDDDLAQAMHDIQGESGSPIRGMQDESRSPMPMDVNEAKSLVSRVRLADEPSSIVPTKDEPKSIVARRPSLLGPPRPLRKPLRESASYHIIQNLAPDASEDEWLAMAKSRREEIERRGTNRFWDFQKARDAAIAKAAEAKILAQLSGLSVEDFILQSSPKKTSSQPIATINTERTTVTLSKTAGDINVGSSRPFRLTATDRTTLPRSEYTRSPRLEARTSAEITPTATRTPRRASYDDGDPWLQLVKEEQLADRTVTELAELSISLQPKLIKPLSQEWISLVEVARGTRPPTKKLVSERSDVTPAALSTLAGKNWLNDAVINEFVGHIVARQQQQQQQQQQPQLPRLRQQVDPGVPPFVALNSNWWNTIHNKGYSVDEGLRKVVRWARRAKIDGAKLLSVSNLFIPINASAHWTLLAISGTDRTIEYLNSLDGCGPRDETVFSVARRYLEMHLGEAYDPGGWTEVSGRSSAQIGGFDCGAFVCFNALALARGLVPADSFGPEDMSVARQRISATLLNDGFQGELDW